jgi:hypothetical protein
MLAGRGMICASERVVYDQGGRDERSASVVDAQLGCADTQPGECTEPGPRGDILGNGARCSARVCRAAISCLGKGGQRSARVFRTVEFSREHWSTLGEGVAEMRDPEFLMIIHGSGLVTFQADEE